MASFQIYEDRANLWRWRFVADNGRIMADSGEGYDSPENAKRGLSRFMELATAPAPEQNATEEEAQNGTDETIDPPGTATAAQKEA